MSSAAHAAFSLLLQLPSGPMRLTRKLERSLADGKAITVERQWAIDFTRNARGITVRGNQVFVRVDAPARLAPLAQIEEARVENGMFPLLLSEAGMLIGTSSTQSRDDNKAAVAQAAIVAERMIAKSARNASDPALARRHLEQMQRASQPLFAALPRDLLFPSAPPVYEMRPVNLPDGSVGEFELTYTARSVPQAGWLASAERRIVTRLGSNARESSENWSLSDMSV